MATTRLLSAMVATWNNVATTFTGLKLNVTDTASASGSLLVDLQVGGVSQLKASKDGEVTAVSRFVAPFYYVNSNTGAIFFGASLDTVIRRDGAANTLALRNGTAAQKFNVYETYTDASNYGRGYVDLAGSKFTIGTEALGTGFARSIYFRTAGADRWQIDSSTGHFLASTDDTYDIGASGANRPRNVYVANNLQAGGGVSVGALAVASGGYIGWTGGKSYLMSGASGDMTLYDASGALSTTFTVGAANLLSLNGGLTLVGQLTPGGISPAATGTSISIGNAGFLQFGSGSGGAARGFLDAPSDGSFRLHNGGDTNSVTMTVGASNLLTLNGGLKTTGATFALQTATTLTDNAAAQVATMTNGPTAGNPTKWIAINDNGVTRYIPAW